MPRRRTPVQRKPSELPLRVLVLDVGGTNVKVYPPGRGARIEIPSGPTMTPLAMMQQIRKQLKGVRYDVVAMGYPGLVVHGKIAREPSHLGMGWVGFDFERALGRPIQIVNDAAMQALGSYRGGRMLFLGLGTGLGSAMIIAGELQPMELAHLPWRKGRSYEDFVGESGFKRSGRKKWQKAVFAVTKLFSDALEPEYVVLGGGNVRKLKRLPPGARAGNNLNAFTGGVRLWRGGGQAVHARWTAASAHVPAAGGD
jgi:predicted NBD/HSP70 family sugar kinase